MYATKSSKHTTKTMESTNSFHNQMEEKRETLDEEDSIPEVRLVVVVELMN